MLSERPRKVPMKMFNYNTLNVTLLKDTRSLQISLARPEKKNAINIEMIFELESLFAWLTGHLEVNTLVLTGEGDYFCHGFDQDELKIMSEEKLQKYIVRFQKLVSGLLYLPQTVICDLKDGASGMGIELAMGADIRVANSTAKLSFDTLERGWVPCSGGVGLLNIWVGQAKARNWTLSGKTVSAGELKSTGFIMESFFSDENDIETILGRIAKQAPIARIQAKRSFLESILPELQRTFEYESIFSFAAMKTEDWKKSSTEDFTQARDLAKELKTGRHRDDLTL